MCLDDYDTREEPDLHDPTEDFNNQPATRKPKLGMRERNLMQLIRESEKQNPGGLRITGNKQRTAEKLINRGFAVLFLTVKGARLFLTEAGADLIR